ncbi:glycoside-pentoside-hexuronide (GPH):cation symporter [Microbacterium suwonense]|uniref:Melibiose:sodium transporter MelB n=1 Tax=Microbacterium suwonense TaxID=683047 RepID=A0ABM8FQ94_9MICO|nr:glycoside-pentoside-hexuronide (GPH):cation symporter [Microbacterium suwonense]BDZ37581.1 melibiose:sodium transporter MelB [Microbacterium suwonense]
MRPARNRYGFGIGTIGRDASYTLVSMYLIFYLSDVLRVSAAVLAAVTVVLVVARVFDAISDPVMGVIVDNTHTRWGRFKPWILLGALVSSALLIVMFTDFGLSDGAFVTVFALVYVLWGLAYTANDIGYWSILPSLTQQQSERERIGAFARICANVGVFAVVIAIVPVSEALTAVTGDVRTAYTLIAVACSILLLVFQTVMLVTVREDPTIVHSRERTRFRELVRLIFRNDQLLVATIALLLFNLAFATTIGFGLYYFTYVYGDVNMYTLFALVLGVAQIAALACYPMISRRMTRRTLFTTAVSTVAAGYIVFAFAPAGSVFMTLLAALLLFSGQAAIQLLMLMFIADTVEYGNWKFGRRNDSVTLSLQPFIYKMSSALSSGVIGWTVIASGMQQAEGAADMTDGGILLVKLTMLIGPLILVVASYVVYRLGYRLDEGRYAQIVAELHERNSLEHDGAAPADDGTAPDGTAPDRPAAAGVEEAR